jgi:hypothetical protein
VDINLGSLSDTIDKGNPCNRTTFARKTSTSVGADVSAESGTKCAILLNLSMIVSIDEHLFLDNGRSVIKSIVKCYHGASGAGKGLRRP